MNRPNQPIRHPNLLIFKENFHLIIEFFFYHRLKFIEDFRFWTFKYFNFVYHRLK